jgi:hypothetical protein
MPNKLTITAFREVMEPITELETKFGGQPVWLEEPLWPVSPTTGKQIPFLCQIKLEPEIFGSIKAQMAYLFFQAFYPESDSYDWTAWGIVLQPGNITVQLNRFQGNQIASSKTGPTLAKSVITEGSSNWKSVPAEFRVNLERGTDSILEIDATYDAYADENFPDEVKIGGSPQLWDCPEILPEGKFKKWNLLLQCRSSDSSGENNFVPFNHDFGEEGCGWWFISKDGLSADFQFQIH